MILTDRRKLRHCSVVPGGLVDACMRPVVKPSCAGCALCVSPTRLPSARVLSVPCPRVPPLPTPRGSQCLSKAATAAHRHWHTDTHNPFAPAARCDLLRARCSSGMRDAGAAVLAAPEGARAEAVAAMLYHVYCDDGVDDLPVEQVGGGELRH